MVNSILQNAEDRQHIQTKMIVSFFVDSGRVKCKIHYATPDLTQNIPEGGGQDVLRTDTGIQRSRTFSPKIRRKIHMNEKKRRNVFRD